MAWMPPPDGIAMRQCDACDAITEGESIHAIIRALPDGYSALDFQPFSLVSCRHFGGCVISG